MNKKLLLGAVSVAALLTAGCSQDQTIELPSSSAISFSNVFVDKSTKTDPSVTNVSSIDKFIVNGYVTTTNGTNQIFSGTEVTQKESGWTYANTQYWIGGAKYQFAAVYPATTSVTSTYVAASTENSNTASIKTVINNYQNNGTTDLLYAAPSEREGLNSGNTEVDLIFNHLLSKVKFTFTNGFPSTSNIYLKVSEVQIKNACKTGTATLTGEQPATNNGGIAWVACDNTITDNKLVLEFGNVTSSTTSTDAEFLDPAEGVSTANSKLIIPTASTVSYIVKFTVKLYQGIVSGTENELVETGSYTHESTISDVNFIPGYSYNFTATLDAGNTNPKEGEDIEPIVFDVEKINGFENATAEDADQTLIAATENK